MLRAHDYDLIAADVQGVIMSPEKQRGGVYGTARQMASCLKIRAIERWVAPLGSNFSGDRRPQFDPDAFVRGTGTLYSLSKEGQGSAGALVTALTAAVVEAAEELATGQAGHAPITDLDSPAGQALVDGMTHVARFLAHAIVRDGEGATKFITVQVEGGRDASECLLAAYAVAHSPLVKTAFFASDPNLGRILAAVGYAGIHDLDVDGIDLHLGDVHVVKGGGRHPDYKEEDGQRVMKQAEILVRIGLGRGAVSETVWTCDFSHEYVTINADYRS